MTAALHVCRHCDDPITDPDDAVEVAYEHGNSGPGWSIWAHRAHAHLVEPDPVPLLILARLAAFKATHRDV
ncbi:hypothetical protein [Streptomyces sp. NBC_00280]|uniref:hypothetical protein n=1 Tax=Streptomyces sp. NBC_00280 TaxID=2975699 RepID=UPI003249BA1C